MGMCPALRNQRLLCPCEPSRGGAGRSGSHGCLQETKANSGGKTGAEESAPERLAGQFKRLYRRGVPAGLGAWKAVCEGTAGKVDEGKGF